MRRGLPLLAGALSLVAALAGAERTLGRPSGASA